jgi:hypothetical protein
LNYNISMIGGEVLQFCNLFEEKNWNI